MYYNFAYKYFFDWIIKNCKKPSFFQSKNGTTMLSGTLGPRSPVPDYIAMFSGTPNLTITNLTKPNLT